MPSWRQGARKRKNQRRRARSARSAASHAESEPGAPTTDLASLVQQVEAAWLAPGPADAPGSEARWAVERLLQTNNRQAPVLGTLDSQARLDTLYQEPTLVVHCRFVWPADLCFLAMLSSPVTLTLARLFLYLAYGRGPACETLLADRLGGPLPAGLALFWRDLRTALTASRLHSEPCRLRFVAGHLPAPAPRLRVSLQPLLLDGAKLTARTLPGASRAWAALVAAAERCCKRARLPALTEFLCAPAVPLPSLLLLLKLLRSEHSGPELAVLGAMLVTRPEVGALGAGHRPDDAFELCTTFAAKCVVCARAVTAAHVQPCCLEFATCRKRTCRDAFERLYCGRHVDQCNMCREETERALWQGDVVLRPHADNARTQRALESFRQRTPRPRPPQPPAQPAAATARPGGSQQTEEEAVGCAGQQPGALEEAG